MIARRGFLAISAMVPAWARATSSPRRHRPRFDQADADVWSVRVVVSGSGAAQVSVNGRPVPTTVRHHSFRASVRLQPGLNRVVATAPDGAVDRVTFRCRLSRRPTPVVAAQVQGGVLRLDGSGSQRSAVTHAPITSYRWRDEHGAVLSRSVSVMVDTATITDRRVISLRVTDREKAHDIAAVVVAPRSGTVQVLGADYRPDWIDKAVLYGVLPPLFGPRPFRAVINQLDRLVALGVSVLWLAPVFRVVPGDYGYEVTDLFEIRPDYGTEAELRHLIDAAHRRGLRVILDLPVNDTSRRHRYFRQAERLGSASHYYSFYERNRHGHPEHYFNWHQLPNLNYDNPEVRAMVIDASVHWLDRLGHDGYRVDAAWGVRRRRPEFWATWSAHLRTRNPDVLLLAEGTARDRWWASNGFDVGYDWTHELGEWAWHAAFGHHDTAHRLHHILGHSTPTTPLRFLDNNDTGRRFVSKHGPGATKAATAMLLTLPGVPELFTGSEIGAEYEPYQRARPLNWARDPHGLEALHRKLLHLRASTPQLSGNGLRLLPADPTNPVLGYLRSSHRADGDVTVLVNFSDQPAWVDAPGFSGILPAWGHHIGRPRPTAEVDVPRR